MILEFDLQEQVMLSSFVPEIVSEMKICLREKREFILHALLNRGNLQMPNGLEGYIPDEGVSGVNISATHMCPEIV
jgi:hypothetical protein